MIPVEAVEAAAKALRDAFDWGVTDFEEQAKRALEAAAPHIRALAWDDGYNKGKSDESNDEGFHVNPDRKYL